MSRTTRLPQLAVAIGCAALLACGMGGRKASAPQVLLATEQDERRLGDASSEWIAGETGVVADPDLQRYVASVGHRVALHAAVRSFTYRFQVLDDVTANSMALPGGAIFVTRGMLALASSEDELAFILGHEIAHVARRHAAAQSAMPGRPADAMVRRWAIDMAAHGRAQEQEADRIGQEMMAAAGYRPSAAIAIMQKIDQLGRLDVEASFVPPYFQTHPAPAARVGALSAAAEQMSVATTAPVARGAAGFLGVIDGLVVSAKNPAQGVLRGRELLFPARGLVLRIPLMGGWIRTSERQATAFWSEPVASIRVEFLAPGSDPETESRGFVANAPARGIRVVQDQRYVLDGKPAHRVRVQIEKEKVWADHTWLRFDGRTYHVGAAGPAGKDALRVFANADAITHGFRSIAQADRDALRVDRLRFAEAREGETLPELSKRTGNTWNVAITASVNGILTDARLREGQRIKIAASEPYESPAR